MIMMKKTIRIFLLLTFAAFASPAAAQISVDKLDLTRDDVTFDPVDTLRSESAMDSEYFSLARYRAERAAIRKERNYLEISGGLHGALTGYSNSWIETSGGDNSVAVTAVFDLKHTFRKNKFYIESRAAAKLGYNRMKVELENEAGEPYSKGLWFKNQDEIELSTAPSFKMSPHWAYGTIIKFRTQFANGYVSRTEQELHHRKSSFMTPGYLDVSLGFTYTSPKPKIPVTVNLSPLALNATFAENDLIRRENGYLYGIEDPDNTSKYEGGSSIQIDFDRTFGKTEFLRYRTMIYAFYGWITGIGVPNKISNYTEFREALAAWDGDIKTKPRLPIHPIVRWTNTIDIKATKYLTTQVSFELYYNRAQHVQTQTKTLLSVGLVYTFKNK